MAKRGFTIAVDFDGVINSYKSGFDLYSLPDPPVPGAIAWLEGLVKDCNVIIHTARIRPDQPNQEPLIRAWLLEHGLSNTALSKLVFQGKPTAHVYLDDRAIRFTGKNFPSYTEIKNNKSWVGESKHSFPDQILSEMNSIFEEE